MQPLDILVVAPHPDDAEISVGGIIAVSLRQNLRVGVVELTSGEPTPHGSLEIRRRETQKATELLGLTWRTNLDLPNRSLQPTLEARRKLAEVAAINSWASFTAFEYGTSWSSFGLSIAKTIRCEPTGSGWNCSLSSVPCRPW